jgi:DNA topoisomerase-3
MLRLHNTFRQFRIEYAEKGREPKVSSNKIGIALVEGYKQYGGYQLNKPDLRREMEAECNHVAAGRKYEEIMTSHSGKDAPVPRNGNSGKRTAGRSRRSPLPRLGSSNTTTQDASPLANAASVITKWRLQEINARGNNNTRRKMVYCNTCSAGCPNCWGEYCFTWKARTAASNQARPICNYQLKVMRGEGYEGNGWHVCPKCFSIQLDHGVSEEKFLLFPVSTPLCALASGTPGGDVKYSRALLPSWWRKTAQTTLERCVRKTSVGYVLSATSMPQERAVRTLIWLPKDVSDSVDPRG